jgi:hypothetical protein
MRLHLSAMKRLPPICHFSVLILASALSGSSAALPSLDEAMSSRTDLWGELAMRQPNGPSYEFFAPILPPLRYVNADFRYYPIVLSAPNATVKARLIANGTTADNAKVAGREPGAVAPPAPPLRYRIGAGPVPKQVPCGALVAGFGLALAPRGER